MKRKIKVILKTIKKSSIGCWLFMLYKKLKRFKIKIFGYGICENVNNTEYNKNCLLLYIVAPFKNKNINYYSHQNKWQVKELVKIISDFGYNVDVIQHNDRRIKLYKKYDLIIDLTAGKNNIYKSYMKDNCLKVAYITGSNPSFLNQAELERINALFRRRGVKLKQRRYTKPFSKKELESFDAMFFMGNEHNLKTFNNFKLPKVYFIKNTGYSFLKNYDFSKKSPKNFLFISGSGMVQKGLDLLLEVFSRNKDLRLYICSKFLSERDFCKLYKKELFESKNIIPVGQINIVSKKFKEICEKCAYVIAPSSSEGISGSVLVAMSAGLIPIVSRECGLNEDEVYILEDCSINTISKTVEDFSKKSINWIKEQSIKAMKIVENNYSKDCFRKSVGMAMGDLLKRK